jgi:hypothetical protein
MYHVLYSYVNRDATIFNNVLGTVNKPQNPCCQLHSVPVLPPIDAIKPL